MTGWSQYAYIPKHHLHLFTHTTFSGLALQAVKLAQVNSVDSETAPEVYI